MPHVGDNDGIAVFGVGQCAHGLAHRDAVAPGVHVMANDCIVFLAPFGGCEGEPLRAFFVPNAGQHGLEGFFRIGMDGQRDRNVFIQFRRIDVDMYDPGMGSITLDVSRHAVAETHAHGDDQVALLGHFVGCQVAVHA